jgi:hypothetical protein
MREEFEKWMQREMPAGTVISDPVWWAPRILKAATAIPDTHRIVSVELLESMRAEFCRAAEDVSDWGDYASTYFQNKHDLKSCIAHYSLQAKKVQAIIDNKENT